MTPKYLGSSVQNPQNANFRWSDVPDALEAIPINLVAADGAPSRGVLYRRRGTRPRTGVHLMHPRTDQSCNYNILPLAMAGCAVIGRAGRWPNNDVATIHEALLLDMAAGVKRLRDEGCAKIVLVGNSGGSSLAALYQAQATTAPPGRLTQTPAGDPFDLNLHDLPPADGIAIVGGHVGQGGVMGKMLDGAVVDEADPTATDPALDIYDPRNGFELPPASSHYARDFLVRYRAAQLDRARGLDIKARALIKAQRESAAKIGRYMIVYRTSADPAFTDLGIDPDDRPVRSYWTSRPDLDNCSESGFGRCLTPRAWLSTWSPLSSNARTIDNLARVAAPLLVVAYAGDAGARMSEVREMVARSAATDKFLHVVRHVDHYGFAIGPDGESGPRTAEGTDKVVSWVRDRFPL